MKLAMVVALVVVETEAAVGMGKRSGACSPLLTTVTRSPPSGGRFSAFSSLSSHPA